MDIDQAHKQNNKLVKIDGGAIGILDNEDALLKWAVAGPFISDMLQQSANDHELHHHEDTYDFEKTFLKEKALLTTAFLEFGNPFSEQINSLIHLVSKQILNDEATKSVMEAEDIGKRQITTFLTQRILTNASPIYDTIKKNNLPLFSHKNSGQVL